MHNTRAALTVLYSLTPSARALPCDAPQNIEAYTHTYCSSNCVMQLLHGVFSRDSYEELCTGLKTLTDDLMLVLQLDGNERLQALQKDTQAALAKLNDEARFKVRKASTLGWVGSKFVHHNWWWGVTD